jgi:hypothetical protein
VPPAGNRGTEIFLTVRKPSATSQVQYLGSGNSPVMHRTIEAFARFSLRLRTLRSAVDRTAHISDPARIVEGDPPSIVVCAQTTRRRAAMSALARSKCAQGA